MNYIKSILYIQDINNNISYFLDNDDIFKWKKLCKYNYYQKYTLPNLLNHYIPNINDFNIINLYADPKYKIIDIRRLTNLKYLYIDKYSKITDYSLSKLTSLTNLICEQNNLISNDSIKKLTNLTCLSLYNSNNINIGINYLINLRYLRIDNDVFDSYINKLTNLEVLQIKSYKITNNLFKNFTKLKELICESVILDDECLSYLPNLTNLECGSGNFSIEMISKLQYLSKLTISFNTIIIDNNLFKNLYKLVYLNCNDNFLLTDEALIYLVNLKFLKNPGINITDISIIRLKELILLECGYNENISNNSIINLTNLKYLHIGNNTKINNTTLKILSQLQYLHLGNNNNITDRGISYLRNLLYLDINNNKKISNKSIDKLLQLKTLNIGKNKKINQSLLNIKNE